MLPFGNWTLRFNEIRFVLFRDNAFFVMGTDGIFGRVITQQRIVNRVEESLSSSGVNIKTVPESLKLLVSPRKRNHLAHYPIEP